MYIYASSPKYTVKCTPLAQQINLMKKSKNSAGLETCLPRIGNLEQPARPREKKVAFLESILLRLLRTS